MSGKRLEGLAPSGKNRAAPSPAAAEAAARFLAQLREMVTGLPEDAARGVKLLLRRCEERCNVCAGEGALT